MSDWTAPVGIPPARPKWFGLPSGVGDLPVVYRISAAAGTSPTLTVGLIALVFDWMAHWAPEGRAPSAHQIGEIAAKGQSPAWRRKHGAAFAQSFIEEVCNEDGECWLFTYANGAAHRTRLRQRAQMRKRRGDA